MIYIESGRTWKQAINSGPVPLGRTEEEFCGFKHPGREWFAADAGNSSLMSNTRKKNFLPRMKTSGTNKKPSPCSLEQYTCRLTSRNKLEEAVWDCPSLASYFATAKSLQLWYCSPTGMKAATAEETLQSRGDGKGLDLALHLNRVGAVAADTYRGNG